MWSNVFHVLFREAKEPMVIEVDGSPVLVKETDLHLLHERMVSTNGNNSIFWNNETNI